MYRHRMNKFANTTIHVNTSYEGETIETKVARVTQNREPINDGVTLVYTERKEGVKPGFDIRTKRWDIAVDAMDTASRSITAKRDEKNKLGAEAKEGMDKENISKTESIHGTGNNPAGTGSSK